MGYFYEVNVANDDIDGRDRCQTEGTAIVQGKNSSDDFEDYYITFGEPLRYKNLNEIMPKTEGFADDVRFYGTSVEEAKRS